MTDRQTKSGQTRIYVYRGGFPSVVGILLLLPLLLVSLSLVAALLVGGGLAAMFLPFFLRRRLRSGRGDTNTIELSKDDYQSVDETRRLP